MERWQKIEYAILKLVCANRGEPKGYPALLSPLTNIIREPVSDCSGDNVRYAIDRLHGKQCLKVEIWDKSLNVFRGYQGNRDDLIQNQFWLQETSNTDLYFDGLHKLHDLRSHQLKKRKIGF